MYDAVVILGSRPHNPETWEFPSHIYKSLDRAAELCNAGLARHIVTSGKWTINFDALNIEQPFTEAQAMADYLKAKVPDQSILQESESKDTISNLYFLKRQIFEPYQLHDLHFVAAEGRLHRIKFLCRRILGPDYRCTFEGVGHGPGEVSRNEARTLRIQREFLAPMQDGEDKWLDGKFFDDPFYAKVRARVIRRAQLEPFLRYAKPRDSA